MGPRKGIDLQRAGQKPSTVKLSLCMIARNEEEFLNRCLASAKPVVDEIIIVDTGSTDRTMEIAKEFGAKVIEFPWSDDFSAARNVGLDQAAGEWILHLDADEELFGEDACRLKKSLSDAGYLAYFLTVVNLRGESEDNCVEQSFPSVRLWRNLPQHRFSGAIHEHVDFGQDKADQIGFVEARIRHFGYLRPVVSGREKQRRNMALLEKSAKNGQSDDYRRYIKANELMSAGKSRQALDLYLKLYDELADSDRMNVPTIIRNIVSCWRNLGKPEKAQLWVERGLNKFNDYVDLEYLQALIHFDADRHREALASFMACLAIGEAPAVYDTQSGIGGWRAWQGAGLAFIKLRRLNAAANAFRRALTINNKDRDSLKELASLLVSAGRNREATEDELAKLTNTTAAEVKQVLESG